MYGGVYQHTSGLYIHPHDFEFLNTKTSSSGAYLFLTMLQANFQQVGESVTFYAIHA